MVLVLVLVLVLGLEWQRPDIYQACFKLGKFIALAHTRIRSSYSDYIAVIWPPGVTKKNIHELTTTTPTIFILCTCDNHIANTEYEGAKLWLKDFGGPRTVGACLYI